MIKNFLLVSMIGGLIGLDRTAMFQIMVSQPIVIAPVIGLLFGNMTAAVAIGIVLQLIWLTSLQIGAAIVFNSTLASVLITASTIEVLNNLDNSVDSFIPVAGLSIFISIPFLFLEQKLDVLVRKTNVFWVKKTEKSINEGNFSKVGFFNICGSILFFTKNFIFLFLSTLFVSIFMEKSLPLFPVNLFEGFDLFFRLLPLLGIAIILESIVVKKNYVYFFLGLFLTIILKIIDYIK